MQGPSKVSIIIPTANRCELLKRAIKSVQNQTHPDWELIIVDDASTDGTVQLVTQLSHDDNRIQLIRNETRSGGGFSRHRGTEAATGDFIAFLDSDDYWLAHKLVTQLKAIRNTNADDCVVVGPMALEFKGKLRQVEQPRLLTSQPIAEYLYCRSGAAIQASSLLVTGALGRKVKFNPALSVNQDTDYLLQLERAGARFIYIPEALHVQDVAPRSDRISLNPGLIEQSLNWFRNNSHDWSTASRRGFYLSDTAIRIARTGNRLRALRYFFCGLSISTSPYYALRQFLRVFNRGELPKPLSKASLLRISSGQFNYWPIIAAVSSLCLILAVIKLQ